MTTANEAYETLKNSIEDIPYKDLRDRLLNNLRTYAWAQVIQKTNGMAPSDFPKRITIADVRSLSEPDKTSGITFLPDGTMTTEVNPTASATISGIKWKPGEEGPIGPQCPGAMGVANPTQGMSGPTGVKGLQCCPAGEKGDEGVAGKPVAPNSELPRGLTGPVGHPRVDLHAQVGPSGPMWEMPPPAIGLAGPIGHDFSKEGRTESTTLVAPAIPGIREPQPFSNNERTNRSLYTFPKYKGTLNPLVVMDLFTIYEESGKAN